MSKFQERLTKTASRARVSRVVSPDDFRMEDGLYVHRGHEQKKIWETAYTTLKELVREPGVKGVVALVGVPGAGKSTWLAQNKQEGFVYFDATLVGKKVRRQFLQRVKTSVKGLPIKAVVLNTPLDLCKSRNGERTADRRVPDHVLDSMASRLATEFPSEDEGWDEIEIVS